MFCYSITGLSQKTQPRRYMIIVQSASSNYIESHYIHMIVMLTIQAISQDSQDTGIVDN